MNYLDHPIKERAAHVLVDLLLVEEVNVALRQPVVLRALVETLQIHGLVVGLQLRVELLQQGLVAVQPGLLGDGFLKLLLLSARKELLDEVFLAEEVGVLEVERLLRLAEDLALDLALLQVELQRVVERLGGPRRGGLGGVGEHRRAFEVDGPQVFLFVEHVIIRIQRIWLNGFGYKQVEHRRFYNYIYGGSVATE